MRFKKVYVEITNVCNLSCRFCHGTKREKRFMAADEFNTVCEKLKPYAEYLYFHVMGEPLLHPKLKQLLTESAEYGFKISLTTNGTLLGECSDVLLHSTALYKVCVSLHSFEANSMNISLAEYLGEVCETVRKLSQNGVICVLRLWNGNADNTLNGDIERFVFSYFGQPDGTDTKNAKLHEKIYLEYAEHFEWPDLSCEERRHGFCMGLRDQLGILCDGTVVPCCLDSEGNIPLGNIFSDNPENILKSERAEKIYNSFSRRLPSEELCRKCGYSKRFD